MMCGRHIQFIHMGCVAITPHYLGVLHEGDELLEINGIPLEGKTIEQMVTLMVSRNTLIEHTPM